MVKIRKLSFRILKYGRGYLIQSKGYLVQFGSPYLVRGEKNSTFAPETKNLTNKTMSFFDIFRKKTDSATNVPIQNNSDHGQTVQQESQPHPAQPPVADGKAHIYNLIIIDESGSMSHLRNATLSGVNETINTIRQAQKDYADKQTHFLTLVTFDSPGPNGKPVRTLIDAMPIDEVKDFSDYCPRGCTPLYDAMGQSISRLYQTIKDDNDASAIVTVMTDGLENASREYKGNQLKELIERLKEEGWTFNYMGSAHDVQSVCDLLSIENVIEFSHDEKGTDEVWNRERMSNKRFFERMNADWEDMKECSATEKREYRRRNSKGFFNGI